MEAYRKKQVQIQKKKEDNVNVSFQIAFVYLKKLAGPKRWPYLHVV